MNAVNEKSNLRIIYDISVLGMGYLNPRSKTGIYRVAEQLLLELTQQPDIQLATTGFNGLSSIWEDISSWRYAQTENSNLAETFKPTWKSNLHLHQFYESAVELQKQLIGQFYRSNPLAYTAAIAIQIPFKLFSKLEIEFNLDPKTFDVYHSPYFALPSHAVLGKAARVLTVHDLMPVLFPQFFTFKNIRKFKLNLASIEIDRDWIICNSQSTKQDFCNYTGMDHDRVFVTPLAAASFFQPVTEIALITATLQRYRIPNQPYLLSLATLEPRKNLSVLIRCFSQIIQDDPSLGLNLVLVGVNGWKNAEIFQAASQNPQLASRIIFTGYVPDNDLSAIYSGATAFVYPSLYEGFGLPPLEAMQCGTPVITSNTSSLPEVVGNAGILIDPTQENELCQAILKVTHNTQLRSTLARQAIQRASQFSWATCAQQTADVYRIAAANSST